jgi:hypothetical protein
MNDCCQDETNRRPGVGPRGGEGLEGVLTREDTTVTHCIVCECRHVEAAADPGQMLSRGSGL